MGGVKDVQSKAELDAALGGRSPSVIHFWASWCEASKQMDQVFSHLCTDFPHVLFLRVEAEEQPEISDAYAVSVVPYFVFCKGGKTCDELKGADPSVLANKVAKIAESTEAPESAAPASLGMAAGPTVLATVKELAKQNSSSLTDTLRKTLQALVDSHPVFLFMKGKPEQPKCKFSSRLVEILKNEGVDFGSFDILSDNEVRDGMKLFSNWPTFPQLYCKGELLGGCDIAASMHENGELKDVFRDHGIVIPLPSSQVVPESDEMLEDRLKNLISSSPVMLFMKGRPDAPLCGFSSKVVNALRVEGVSFGFFDILSDDEIRQGLKTYSNWPTFPQLYCRGELIGGCDIVLELSQAGELKSALSE